MGPGSLNGHGRRASMLVWQAEITFSPGSRGQRTVPSKRQVSQGSHGKPALPEQFCQASRPSTWTPGPQPIFLPPDRSSFLFSGWGLTLKWLSVLRLFLHLVTTLSLQFRHCSHFHSCYIQSLKTTGWVVKQSEIFLHPHCGFFSPFSPATGPPSPSPFLSLVLSCWC